MAISKDTQTLLGIITAVVILMAGFGFTNLIDHGNRLPIVEKTSEENRIEVKQCSEASTKIIASLKYIEAEVYKMNIKLDKMHERLENK